MCSGLIIESDVTVESGQTAVFTCTCKYFKSSGVDQVCDSSKIKWSKRKIDNTWQDTGNSLPFDNKI